MKKIMMLTATLICCLFVSIPANAEESITYKRCGDCELIVKHTTNWLGGDWTTYGLARNGVTMLAPDCELLSYNEELHLAVFRDCASSLSAQYHIYLYNTRTGKCVHSGRYFAQKVDVRVPWLTFERNGKYTHAVVHYFSPNFGDKRGIATKTVGSFFMKDGKLHQVLQKQVNYEAAVE